MGVTTPYGDAGRVIVAALGGGDAELRELARRSDLREIVRAGRVGAALALRAAVVGLAGREVEDWHAQLVEATARGPALRRALAVTATGLAAERITWAPIGVLGLSPHAYSGWEERPTHTIEVLIAEVDLARARAALQALGWIDAEPGAPEPDPSFLRTEGYRWRAVDASAVPLDLYFRLWSCAPSGLAGALLTRAEADPKVGPTARRLRLADSWVLRAIEWWTMPAVRPLQHLWDLHRIAAAAGDRLANDVTTLVRRWGLHLFAAPLAEACGALWGLDAYRTVGEVAAAGMRRPERWALGVIERLGVEHAGLEMVSLARLLSERRSRLGPRALWRRVWPHPAVLRRQSPPEWRWLRRRAWFVARQLGLIGRGG